MKFSLLVLYLIEELEAHNVDDVIKNYKQLGPDISLYHMGLIFRRGLSISFSMGGISAARQHWTKLKPLTSDNELKTSCEKVLRDEDSFKQIMLTHEVKIWSVT